MGQNKIGRTMPSSQVALGDRHTADVRQKTMTPNQIIAEQVKTDLAHSSQETEKAQRFGTRFFIGLGIVFIAGGTIGLIFVPGWSMTSTVLLVLGGLEFISVPLVFYKKRKSPEDRF
jgi:hypothetical protein